MRTKHLILDKRERKKLQKPMDRKINSKVEWSNLLPPGHSINDVYFFPSPQCLVHHQPLVECFVK